MFSTFGANLTAMDIGQIEFVGLLSHFLDLEERGLVDDAFASASMAIGAARLFERFGEAGWGPLAEAAGATSDEVEKMDRECRFLYAELLAAMDKN